VKGIAHVRDEPEKLENRAAEDVTASVQGENRKKGPWLAGVNAIMSISLLVIEEPVLVAI
jgi:hypothetical protein